MLYQFIKKGDFCIPCMNAWLCPALCDLMEPGGIFPGKNIGVGYHFLFQGIFPAQVPNPCLLPWLCLVAQSCPTLSDPVDCSPPGSSVLGDSPGKNTRMGCHSFCQKIFATKGLVANPCNPPLQVDSLPTEPPGKLAYLVQIKTVQIDLQYKVSPHPSFEPQYPGSLCLPWWLRW